MQTFNCTTCLNPSRIAFASRKIPTMNVIKTINNSLFIHTFMCRLTAIVHAGTQTRAQMKKAQPTQTRSLWNWAEILTIDTTASLVSSNNWNELSSQQTLTLQKAKNGNVDIQQLKIVMLMEMGAHVFVVDSSRWVWTKSLDSEEIGYLKKL